jgi:hypothetical protein
MKISKFYVFNDISMKIRGLLVKRDGTGDFFERKVRLSPFATGREMKRPRGQGRALTKSPCTAGHWPGSTMAGYLDLPPAGGATNAFIPCYASGFMVGIVRLSIVNSFLIASGKPGLGVRSDWRVGHGATNPRVPRKEIRAWHSVRSVVLR